MDTTVLRTVSTSPVSFGHSSPAWSRCPNTSKRTAGPFALALLGGDGYEDDVVTMAAKPLAD